MSNDETKPKDDTIKDDVGQMNVDNQDRFANEIGSLSARKLEDLIMNVTNGCFLSRGAHRCRLCGLCTEEEMAKPLAERLPPTSLRHYYGFKDGKYHDDLYLKTGLNDTTSLRKILTEDGFEFSNTVAMEFGCSGGRLIRHFEEEAHHGEFWGVDLHSAAIHWAQAHEPAFPFLHHLNRATSPIRSNYFDLIFAGSVWTHISELDDAWLLEMHRILKPGGRLYVTISDENTLAEVKRISPDHPSNQHVQDLDDATGMLTKNWSVFANRTTPWLQRVVYRQAWLNRISRWFQVVMARPNAYGWQTGVLCKSIGAGRHVGVCSKTQSRSKTKIPSRP